MVSFWDSSWERLDPERLRQYINDFDLEPDGIIEYLLSQQVKSVCDAGCGCGIYSLKLAANGFSVSGFDISAHAVDIAKKLLENASFPAKLKTASVLATGYDENQFDCVISRDVLDHMRKKDGIAAIQELYRITKPGGILLITLDHPDREYEEEPHSVNSDGDFLFAAGKWEGMVFHPYQEWEIKQMIPSGAICRMETTDGEILVKLIKPTADCCEKTNMEKPSV